MSQTLNYIAMPAITRKQLLVAYMTNNNGVGMRYSPQVGHGFTIDATDCTGAVHSVTFTAEEVEMVIAEMRLRGTLRDSYMHRRETADEVRMQAEQMKIAMQGLGSSYAGARQASGAAYGSALTAKIDSVFADLADPAKIIKPSKGL